MKTSKKAVEKRERLRQEKPQKHILAAQLTNHTTASSF